MQRLSITKCSTCGNRHPHYQGDCPLKEIYREGRKTEVPEDLFGGAPSVFVGRHGYPKVNLGPMATEDDDRAQLIQNPEKWFQLSYDEIIKLQAFTVRSKSRTEVGSRDRFVEENQLLSMAERPTDVELSFAKKPTFNFQTDRMVNPGGLSGPLEDLDIAEHVKIGRAVEKTVSDELKATDQMRRLYEKGVSIYRIMSILSSGTLGEDQGRKLVPTRWSITAVDDTISKQLLSTVKTSPSINDFRIYESNFLYNDVCILLMPGSWEYEAFESWPPNSLWGKPWKYYMIQEYEPYNGRTDYADEMGGCYYSTRLAVAEALAEEGRQARCIAFREVHEGYNVPVGVWQVRENVRNALQEEPRTFDTREKALDYVGEQMKIPLEKYVEQSTVLGQKRIVDFA